MFPVLSGKPIRVELRETLGPHMAATFIPRRLILLDQEVLAKQGEFERILIHEIFHFVWVRLSNQVRHDWGSVLAAENAPGELGWSAERRKLTLSKSDARLRSAKWRHYSRESFCDSAAWMFSGLSRHEEFTLPAAARRVRKAWFQRNFASRDVHI